MDNTNIDMKILLDNISNEFKGNKNIELLINILNPEIKKCVMCCKNELISKLKECNKCSRLICNNHEMKICDGCGNIFCKMCIYECVYCKCNYCDISPDYFNACSEWNHSCSIFDCDICNNMFCPKCNSTNNGYTCVKQIRCIDCDDEYCEISSYDCVRCKKKMCGKCNLFNKECIDCRESLLSS